MVSTTFLYLNAYKRGIALDATNASGRDVLARLVQQADAVVSSAAGRQAIEDAFVLQALVAEANPRCVHTVVTPYGLTGPYRDNEASDLTDWAVSGYLQITGEPDREPLQGAGPWCGYATGLTAAVVTAAAMRHARSTGNGQLVDVGTMEAMAGLHQWSLVLYTHQGVVKRRAGNRHAESYHPLGLQPCKDGSICIAASGQPHWERLCLAMQRPELLLDERFNTGAGRFDHADEIDALIRPWFMAHTREQLVAILQECRIPAASVLTMTEVLAEPVLAERGFWAKQPLAGGLGQMPAAPIRLATTPAHRPAPTLGEHTLEVLTALRYDADARRRLVTTGVVAAGSGTGAVEATQ
jgi:CoA:oxalate CoA-transferase